MQSTKTVAFHQRFVNQTKLFFVKDLQTPLTDKKGQEDLLTEEVCFALRV